MGYKLNVSGTIKSWREWHRSATGLVRTTPVNFFRVKIVIPRQDRTPILPTQDYSPCITRNWCSLWKVINLLLIKHVGQDG